MHNSLLKPPKRKQFFKVLKSFSPLHFSLHRHLGGPLSPLKNKLCSVFFMRKLVGAVEFQPQNKTIYKRYHPTLILRYPGFFLFWNIWITLVLWHLLLSEFLMDTVIIENRSKLWYSMLGWSLSGSKDMNLFVCLFIYISHFSKSKGNSRRLTIKI